MQKFKLISIFAGALLFGVAAQAQEAPNFDAGPVLDEFGAHVPVDHTSDLGPETKFKVSFDVVGASRADKYNMHIESAARFMNMHVANGVRPEHINLAVVVHGAASTDLVHHAAWQALGKGDINHTEALVRDLLAAGVRVIICGQSAAAHDISPEELIPGVEIALSAMTAHALLQQDGYTLNPF